MNRDFKVGDKVLVNQKSVYMPGSYGVVKELGSNNLWVAYEKDGKTLEAVFYPDELEHYWINHDVKEVENTGLSTTITLEAANTLIDFINSNNHVKLNMAVLYLKFLKEGMR